jgi:hypothetical protein
MASNPITGEEIDLREKIASEIVAFAESQSLSEDAYWGFMRAVGVIREKIWHSFACPCSSCAPKESAVMRPRWNV